MHAPKNILYAIAVLLCLSVTGCREETVLPDYPVTPAPVQNTHPRSAQFDQFVQNEVKAGLPGMVMLVSGPAGTWAGAAGRADLQKSTPLSVHHAGRIASITKTYTAVLFLKLAEAGVIQLDDPAARWLDGKMASRLPNAEKVTIRQLLNHTGGIFNYSENITFDVELINRPHRVKSRRKLFEYAYGKPAYFAPGADFHYSNTGYELLGEIAEKATGKRLRQLFAEYLFTPLGLQHTYFDDVANVPAPLMKSYQDLYENGSLLDVTLWDRSGERAATDIVTTAYDLYCFGNALLRGGFVADNYFRQMKDWVQSGEDTYYGLGLGRQKVLDSYAVLHTGGLPGYTSFLVYFEAYDTLCVILTNSSGGIADQRLEKILERTLEAVRAEK